MSVLSQQETTKQSRGCILLEGEGMQETHFTQRSQYRGPMQFFHAAGGWNSPLILHSQILRCVLDRGQECRQGILRCSRGSDIGITDIAATRDFPPVFPLRKWASEETGDLAPLLQVQWGPESDFTIPAMGQTGTKSALSHSHLLPPQRPGSERGTAGQDRAERETIYAERRRW